MTPTAIVVLPFQGMNVAYPDSEHLVSHRIRIFAVTGRKEIRKRLHEILN